MELCFFLAIGAVFGSFLNVLIWRIPRGENIAWPGSHCPKCSHALAWRDNIPVLSYVFLKGKCRFCSTAISMRYPFVEILASAATLVSFLKFDNLPYAVMSCVILYALIVITYIDIDHQIIPDYFSIGGLIAGVLFSSFFPEWISYSAIPVHPAFQSLISALIGGGFLYLIAFAATLALKKEAMGGGDIKYLAAVGAFFGWQSCFFVLFFGSAFGSVGALILRGSRLSEKIPFGPYLAMATAVYMLAGEEIIGWYLATMLQ